MYVCGITPYDATHLGHAFTYLTYDVLYRTLLDAGAAVSYVQNVTDVDDPLLERAARDGVDWRDLAEREIDRFRGDMVALRNLPPTAYVGAVEAIPLVIGMIETLRDRGAAYHVDGDVYFSVASAARFGEVAHLDHAEMVRRSAAGGGDPERPGKKDPLDPLLWRAWRPGEPSWPSPFGPGRPGWHVECAAIAGEYLGPTVDIQGGGIDLLYPHHECGAAHAEVATGQAPFAALYVYSGLVALDGQKMSKSLGNLEFVWRLRAAGAHPSAVRLALLAHHHGSDWEWTHAELDDASHRLARWRRAVELPAGPAAARVLAEVRTRLADDLDTPGALAAVDRWVQEALAVDAPAGTDDGAPRLVRQTVDALLGVDLSGES